MNKPSGNQKSKKACLKAGVSSQLLSIAEGRFLLQRFADDVRGCLSPQEQLLCTMAPWQNGRMWCTLPAKCQQK
jgi:hypothetical protein